MSSDSYSQAESIWQELVNNMESLGKMYVI